MISSFKKAHPEFSDQEVHEMRKALVDAGDIQPIWGLTRATRYQLTDAGKTKPDALFAKGSDNAHD